MASTKAPTPCLHPLAITLALAMVIFWFRPVPSGLGSRVPGFRHCSPLLSLEPGSCLAPESSLLHSGVGARRSATNTSSQHSFGQPEVLVRDSQAAECGADPAHLR